MSKSDTWVGLGLQGGGTMLVVGWESTEGYMVRGKMETAMVPVSTTGPRIGIGLGASVGLVAMFAFNCSRLTSLDKKWSGSPAANAALPTGKVSSKGLSVLFKLADKLEDLDELKKAMDKMATVEALLTVAADISNTNSAASAVTTEPTLLVLPVPLAGTGLELTAHWSEQRFSVDF